MKDLRLVLSGLRIVSDFWNKTVVMASFWTARYRYNIDYIYYNWLFYNTLICRITTTSSLPRVKIMYMRWSRDGINENLVCDWFMRKIDKKAPPSVKNQPREITTLAPPSEQHLHRESWCISCSNPKQFGNSELTASVSSWVECGTIYPWLWSNHVGGRRFESRLWNCNRGSFSSNQTTSQVSLPSIAYSKLI